jgi:hypothetical protein
MGRIGDACRRHGARSRSQPASGMRTVCLHSCCRCALFDQSVRQGRRTPNCMSQCDGLDAQTGRGGGGDWAHGVQGIAVNASTGPGNRPAARSEKTDFRQPR